MIYEGDCKDAMTFHIPSKSVQCCVTSPPYFGLRDYGNAEQIGLEKTPAEYVAALVEVFAGVRDVLRDDGTLWLNLGDSYARNGGTDRNIEKTGKVGNTLKTLEMLPNRKQSAPEGLQAKQLLGIPWRVAFALQADGWYLRQDIIWHKPNPMPESVTDRCTKAHEYLFLLTKSERYFWDAAAMQEKAVGMNLHDLTGQGYAAPGQTPNRGNRLPGNGNPPKGQAAYEAGDDLHRTKAGLLGYAERQRSKRDSFKRDDSKRAEVIPGQTVGTHRPDREESSYPTATRNKRSVWTVATRPYKGAHFATYPPALIEPCILAGSRPGDTVFDPFAGSGTTGAVAVTHGRKFVGCELNPEYIKLADARIAKALEDRLW